MIVYIMFCKLYLNYCFFSDNMLQWIVSRFIVYFNEYLYNKWNTEIHKMLYVITLLHMSEIN